MESSRSPSSFWGLDIGFVRNNVCVLLLRYILRVDILGFNWKLSVYKNSSTWLVSPESWGCWNLCSFLVCFCWVSWSFFLLTGSLTVGKSLKVKLLIDLWVHFSAVPSSLWFLLLRSQPFTSPEYQPPMPLPAWDLVSSASPNPSPHDSATPLWEVRVSVEFNDMGFLLSGLIAPYKFCLVWRCSIVLKSSLCILSKVYGCFQQESCSNTSYCGCWNRKSVNIAFKNFNSWFASDSVLNILLLSFLFLFLWTWVFGFYF